MPLGATSTITMMNSPNQTRYQSPVNRRRSAITVMNDVPMNGPARVPSPPATVASRKSNDWPMKNAAWLDVLDEAGVSAPAPPARPEPIAKASRV